MFYLNECSLIGQFNSIDNFVETDLADVMRCINLINKANDRVITKTQGFYKSKITRDERLSDVFHVQSDEMDRIRHLFANEIFEAPFWDEEEIKQNIEAQYTWKDIDVSCSSMAEAAETGNALLSFSLDGLIDQEISVLKEYDKQKETLKTLSIHTDKFLVEVHGNKLNISRTDILNCKYRNTRINFSQLEEAYGADTISEEQFNRLVSTINKFVKHESFESIALDDGLEYKKYTPENAEKNWFRSAKYKNKTIMKFRFSRKWRVFGYRKDDKFFVLRFEVDHSISDYG